MASELLERKLYNGKFHVIHNPEAKGRQPRYKVNDETPVGVTTLLSKVLGKDLMKWAVDSACNHLYEVLQHKVIEKEDIETAAKAYITKRDFGSNTGTEAHALVELYLKGKGEELDEKLQNPSQEALNAYKAFIEWFEDAMPDVINVEEVVYSRLYKYAGTYDCMLKVDGLNYLCDFKTTNISKMAPKGVYPEMFLQLGAYANAHEEQRLYEKSHGGTELEPIEGLMIISGKKDGRLDIVTNNDVGLDVTECMQFFIFVKGLYDFITETGRRLT
jgi:hypothetical protein